MSPSRTTPDPVAGRTAAVVLAAGLGTRMRSRTPKVLHPLCGRPMLAFVLDAWEDAQSTLEGGGGAPVVVYSPATEALREALGDRGTYALQEVPRGTGDAVRVALDAIPEAVAEVLVLSGDVPLVVGQQLIAVLEQRRLDDAAIALASVFSANPGELGRVVRSEFGSVERIVEARDASPEVGWRQTESNRAYSTRTSIFRGFASSALGSCKVNTPCLRSADILDWSTFSFSSNWRKKLTSSYSR